MVPFSFQRKGAKAHSAAKGSEVQVNEAKANAVVGKVVLAVVERVAKGVAKQLEIPTRWKENNRIPITPSEVFDAQAQ